MEEAYESNKRSGQVPYLQELMQRKIHRRLYVSGWAKFYLKRHQSRTMHPDVAARHFIRPTRGMVPVSLRASRYTLIHVTRIWLGSRSRSLCARSVRPIFSLKELVQGRESITSVASSSSVSCL